MLITMVISLYSTRLILNALGATDYGVFNLIGGIIAMLSFLNAAMTVSTQRYLSYYQGKSDFQMQKRVFANSLIIHIAIGIVIVIGLELMGLFLFDGFLKIPESRIIAAKTIFHFMSVTVFFTVLSVPFTASLNARENMTWTAIVNVIESLLKLAIAIFLVTVSNDRLIVYGILSAIISVVSLILYAVFCFKKYDECSLSFRGQYDRKLVEELSSFAGWNLFGTLAGIGRIQGLAVILNLFFGATVNAAYGIANQVSAQLNFFSATMMRALNPQIMKSEGANDRKRMLRLSMLGSKFCFFLLAFIAIPCIFEMKEILQLWLKNVPEYTVMFCNLILIAMLTNQLTIGLQSAFQATGKIKVYQVLVGTILILNLPVAYFLLKLGFPVYSVLISYIGIEAVACLFRIFLLRSTAGLSIREYISRVLAREVIPILCSVGVCVFFTHMIHLPFRFMFTSVASSIAFASSIYLVGLCNDEKQLVNQMIVNTINKIKK